MSTAVCPDIRTDTPVPKSGLRKLAIISFAYAADGTVTATCRGVRGTGPTDVAALRDMGQRVKAARQARK